MDIQETSRNTEFTTDSNLSTWSGPNVLTMPTPLSSVREDDDQIKSDAADWNKRLFCLTDYRNVGTSLGPGISPDYGFLDVLNITKSSFLPYRQSAQHYSGFRYDSIDVRITLSAPKSLVGGAFVGWYPFVDYYDETVQGTIDVYLDNAFQPNCKQFLNTTNTHFMLLGEAADVTFTIPWTFKHPFLPTKWIAEEKINGTQDERPVYGWPIIFWKLAPDVSFVSSITQFPANLQAYVRYNNPRFYGPVGPSTFTKQSGLEPLGAAALAVAAETGLSYVAQAASSFVETSSSAPTTDDAPGSFSEPQAVQMSYFGDTTDTNFPASRPVFRGAIPPPTNAPVPTVHDILSRPQFVGSHNSTLRVPIDPMLMATNGYFEYFGMINQYWRGTIVLDIIVANHDFIECFLEVTVVYPGGGASTGSMDVMPTYRSLFSGSKCVTVPLPYLFCLDYLPVNDQAPTAPHQGLTAWCDINLEVRSTMLDAVPNVPFYVFARAGPDFKYYQPYPPGLYNVTGVSPIEVEEPVQKQLLVPVPKRRPIKKAEMKKMSKQIFLPLADDADIVPTDASVTPDPGVLVSQETLYDYMKLWSRSVSFYDYNNITEEPIPDPGVGLSSPCWFPPVDRSREIGDDNSWYCTQDYVSYLSHLFLYWRGSIATKVAVSNNRSATATFVYASLAHSPSRAQSRTPWSFAPSDLPPDANFGVGAVATPVDLQPVFEVSIPFRGYTVWGYNILNAYTRGVGRQDDLPPLLARNNIETVNDDDVLADSTYRKIDSDFALCLESTLPPFGFWRNRGHAV